ncbi:uncharacterized protein B0H18DRAFT_20331 [Fomitopsis serialis]|uniref:uncharacterized protein n=1 Tax=Fomitopsis serialis TaxID=139415 RepID=UPI002008E187|nr:uncharacterized protein B0H18DRAFT_20331 [Neoantrodia serialis]KAH9938603.1 hypothetical protein B0H18DRAFT_20331 [Neoantrodia serialis]
MDARKCPRAPSLQSAARSGRGWLRRAPRRGLHMPYDLSSRTYRRSPERAPIGRCPIVPQQRSAWRRRIGRSSAGYIDWRDQKASPPAHRQAAGPRAVGIPAFSANLRACMCFDNYAGYQIRAFRNPGIMRAPCCGTPARRTGTGMTHSYTDLSAVLRARVRLCSIGTAMPPIRLYSVSKSVASCGGVRRLPPVLIGHILRLSPAEPGHG